MLCLCSQYWQGLINEHSNPLHDVWDSMPLEVVSTMQSAATIATQGGTNVPIIHFGRIKFDYSVGFVRGGFSRVYFGEYLQERVAIKMLFVMELTKESVESFYAEARVLMSLQHEHVITCRGITLLPPAVS